MKDIYFQYALRRPVYYPGIIKVVFQKIIRLIRRKFQYKDVKPFNNKDFNTPKRKEIASDARKIKLQPVPVHILNNLPAFDLNIKKGLYDIKSISIPLASSQVKLTRQFFNQKQEDPEDYYAANRFIWLYEVLLKYPYQNVIEYCYEKILRWVEENPIVIEDKRFESYSISERIIAFLFFLQFTKAYKCKPVDLEKMAVSIIEQLKHLLWNLEYHGDKTNNHVLNNARALYIAGRLLKIGEIEHLAKKILTNEWPLVFDDGTYLEGSSHYQFLLTKNFLEMQLVADLTNDSDYIKTWKEKTNRMLFNCNILQSKYSENEYPMFGDISPDMAHDWFIGNPFSIKGNMVSKWASLFRYKLQDFVFKTSETKEVSTEGVKAQWLYLEKNRFEVWSTLRNGKISGHGHNDNGSVVIFYEGRPLIIDPGLCTYIEGQKKEQQVSYLAHNTPVINSFPPDASRNSMMTNSMGASRAFGIKAGENIMEYNLQYANRSIIINRQIAINNNVCTIIDKCDKADQLIDYQASWIFTDRPNQLSPNIFSIKNLNFEVLSDQKIHFSIEKFSNRSLKYGELLPAFRMILGTKLKKNPLKISVKLN